MSTRDFLAIARRRYVIIALFALVAVGVAAFVGPSGEKTVRFRATATVAVLASRASTPTPVALEPVSADIAAVLVTLGDVPARVAARVQGDAGELANRVTVKTSAQTQTLDVSITDRDPEQAQRLANAFAEELLDVLEDRRVAQVRLAIESAEREAAEYLVRIQALEARITPTTTATDPIQAEREIVQRQYASAFARIDALQGLQGPEAARATIIQAAIPQPAPREGLSPPAARVARVIVAGLVGLLIGLALAMILEKADPHLLSKEDAAEAFGAPVLAEVPYIPGSKRRERTILTLTEPRSAVAEAYRNVRTSMLFLPAAEASANGPASGAPGDPAPAAEPAAEPAAGRRKIVLVVSPGPSEGKTTCVANLAASVSELRRSVLLMSGDLHKPTLHTYFGLPHAPGFTDLALNKPGSLNDTKLVRSTRVPNVWLIPSGKPVPNPAILVASMRELLNKCRPIADLILVDTPPLLLTNDARELLTIADAVVLVGRAAQTTVREAIEAGNVLRQLKAPVIGVVFIGDASSQGYGKYGKYGQYYGSDSGGDNGHQTLRRRLPAVGRARKGS